MKNSFQTMLASLVSAALTLALAAINFPYRAAAKITSQAREGGKGGEIALNCVHECDVGS